MHRAFRQSLPIGYWLRRADELITKEADRWQEANDITRTQWMTLNLIHDKGTAGIDEIYEVMKTFLDQTRLQTTINYLKEQNWIELVDQKGEGDECFRLSSSGDERFSVALQDQEVGRKQIMEGISEEEFETTMGVLRRMVDNLEEMGDE